MKINPEWQDDPSKCDFCGSEESVRPVGVAIGISGHDYTFCQACLEKSSADHLLKAIYEHQGFEYPPEQLEEIG